MGGVFHIFPILSDSKFIRDNSERHLGELGMATHLKWLNVQLPCRYYVRNAHSVNFRDFAYKESNIRVFESHHF